MKRLYTLLTAALLTTLSFAQAPEKMSYQAVVRDANNALVSNQTIGMQISILQGSISGNAVYVETQTPTSNPNGLVSIEIGTGTVASGTFSTIDWSNGPYFIKTETDPAGGAAYTISGTSQLLSVPYAYHANTADSLIGGVNITESDPVFGASVASGITATDTANWNIQTIDTQIDSAGIAALGYVAGPHTVVDPTSFNGANPAVDFWSNPDPAPSSTSQTITIQTASITVPGPGKIVATFNVDVYCNAGCDSIGDFASANITLTTSPTAAASTGSFAFMYVGYPGTNSCSRTAVFDATAAGTTTVYLRGTKSTFGVGTEVGFYRPQITLFFIPN